MSSALKQDITYEGYAAGRLSPAKHALLSEYLSLNPFAANDAAFEERVAGEMLSDTNGEALDEAFFDKVAEALEDLPIIQAEETRKVSLTDKLNTVKWRTRLPGISTHDIVGGRKGDGDRLFLLKVKPGFTIWDHTHNGDEWVLVLKGEYTSGGETFKAGALHIEDEASEHSLTAGTDEDCICLVMTQGPVKMNSVLGKLLSPIVGL